MTGVQTCALPILSLGATKPFPNAKRGMIVNAAAASPALFKKLLLDTGASGSVDFFTGIR